MKETRFKDTEIGRIPMDWEVVSLGELGDVRMCKRVMKHQTSNKGAIPFYKIGTFGKQADAYISRELFDSYKAKYHYPKKGDILLSAAGTIGRTVRYDGMPSYFQDSNIVWIENAEDRVSNELLYFIYKNLKWVTESGTIPRIYNSIVSCIKFIIPASNSEQKSIASALTSIDNLIASLDKLIEKKKNIKQGTMQQLLTGKKRLKGFTEPWVDTILDNHVSIGHGRDYKGLKKGPIPVFGTGGYMTSVSECLYDGPTVCIGRKGTINRPQYHEGPIWTVDTLFFLHSFDGVIPKFLYYLFCTIDWLAMNEATGVPSLTANSIEKLEVVLPSMAEQTAISTVLASMDNDISALESKKTKYESIKQDMMQQLLSGSIRLININYEAREVLL